MESSGFGFLAHTMNEYRVFGSRPLTMYVCASAEILAIDCQGLLVSALPLCMKIS